MNKPLPLLLLAACAGDDATEAPEPIEDYACVHVAEGDLVDASADRAAAPLIAVGRAPYRINLPAGVPSWIAFESDGAPLVLLVDSVGAASAVWTGEDRAELDAGAPNPSCDEDIPEVHELSLAAGRHLLELGPIYQANVWLMLGS